MKNKEIEELLKYLKENDYVRLDDNRTYKLLQDDEDKLLLSYIEQLENNRDKAIEYLKEKADYPISYYHCIRETIDILKGDSDGNL